MDIKSFREACKPDTLIMTDAAYLLLVGFNDDGNTVHIDIASANPTDTKAAYTVKYPRIIGDLILCEDPDNSPGSSSESHFCFPIASKEILAASLGNTAGKSVLGTDNAMARGIPITRNQVDIKGLGFPEGSHATYDTPVYLHIGDSVCHLGEVQLFPIDPES